MKVYVASKSSNVNYALDTENIIEACATGPDPLADAKSYARDYVEAEEGPAYIFEVEARQIGRFSMEKVVSFDSTAK